MNARTGSMIGHASENEIRIALNYKEAAEILYKSEAYQDGITLPFLFLIRQFLELGLKYNIRRLSEVSTHNDLLTVLNGTHDLKKIYGAFLTHYKGAKSHLGINKVGEQKYLDSLEALLDKVMPLDTDSQGFRYSVDKSGQKIIPYGKTFNLKEVFDLLEDVTSFLTSVEDVFGIVQ